MTGAAVARAKPGIVVAGLPDASSSRGNRLAKNRRCFMRVASDSGSLSYSHRQLVGIIVLIPAIRRLGSVSHRRISRRGVVTHQELLCITCE